MRAVFISYASGDRPTASAIARHLHPFYDVFLDATSIHGGTRWAQEIEAGIRGAQLVLALVSPESTASVWVGRELALAEQLGKTVVPVLLAGDMPWRLMDVQYVDFRADFEGAVAELLRAIRAHAEPVARQGVEADHFLASAMRARLAGRVSTADELFARAVELDASLGAHRGDPWVALGAAQAPERRAPAFDHFNIVERTVLLEADGASQRKRYQWSLRIEGPAGFVEAVDAVHYALHRTFRPPNQTVRSPENGFQITCVGWGQFEVGIAVQLRGGRTLDERYMLSFLPHAERRVAVLPAPLAGRAGG